MVSALFKAGAGAPANLTVMDQSHEMRQPSVSISLPKPLNSSVPIDPNLSLKATPTVANFGAVVIHRITGKETHHLMGLITPSKTH